MSRGLVIQLVGPDGVGKSTLARALVTRLGERGEARHFYVRPALLPMPGELVGKPSPGVVTNPHGRKLHSWPRALARLVYYAVDFIAGYWAIYRPILGRGGFVVVERGWQDLEVDNRRYLMPSDRPAKLIGRLVPRPDVVVILAPPVADVISRKDELGPTEVERQLDAWRASASARQRVIELDSRASPRDLVETLLAALPRG
jgi:thymidylate kinase